MVRGYFRTKKWANGLMLTLIMNPPNGYLCTECHQEGDKEMRAGVGSY